MSLDLRERDPKGARFNAIAQAVLVSLVGCIVGFVAAGLLVGMDRTAGWLIVAAGTGLGLVPIGQWLRDRRAPAHVDLFDIDASLRPLLVRAAAAADRVDKSAAAAPVGPIADLLDENHRSALAHVRLLESDAKRRGTHHRPEMLRVCHQLDELATASEQLLHTALDAQPTVLNALIERTELVRETLGSPELGGAVGGGTAGSEPEPPTSAIEASGEPDRADRCATNGH